MRKIVLIALMAVWESTTAQAHSAGPALNESRWTFDPWIVGPLAAFAGMYALGLAALYRRRPGRGARYYWQEVAGVAGWLSMVGALVSPLHWLGERLFSFHMIEHEILMAVSAPLLVMARPVGALLWSLPRRARLAVGRTMRRPLVRHAWDRVNTGAAATLLHGVVIWVWHAPVLFDAAVDDLLLHRLQHLSFFATAVLFWWSVLRRNAPGPAAWHLFVTMLHTSVLGALLALAPRVLYQRQTATAAAWGLTPLDDQQLAGLIMWVPAGTVYAGAALALIAIWIDRVSRNRGDAGVMAAS